MLGERSSGCGTGSVWLYTAISCAAFTVPLHLTEPGEPGLVHVLLEVSSASLAPFFILKFTHSVSVLGVFFRWEKQNGSKLVFISPPPPPIFYCPTRNQ